MPPAGPTAADLTVVVSSDDVDGHAVRELALQWHQDGLLGDFAWVTPSEVDRGGHGPPVVRARVTGRDVPVELMSHIGMRPRALIRVVLLHLLTHEMSDPDTLVETCDEIAELVNRSRPRTLDPHGRHQGSQLLRVNLMVPESDLLPQDPRIILPAWEINAVVSPEDRPELDRQSVFVRRSVNLHSHALAAAATVGGLWAEVATGVFDSHESDSTTGGGEIVVLRCQARVVVGDDGVERLTRTVIEALEDSPVGAPAWVAWGVPADDPTALVRSCTEDLMTHPEWAPLARDEEPLHKQQIPLGAAIRQWLTFQLLLVPAVFHFLFGWGRGIVERRVTALTVGRDAGEEGRVHPLPPDAVERIAKGRMKHLEDDLSPNRLDEEAGAWARTTPAAWRELRQLALGLVDGGRLSARFTRGGHGGAVETVPPGSVVGAPDDHYELSSGLRIGLVDVELAADAVAEIEKAREEEERTRARRAADAERAARYPSRGRAGTRQAPRRATPAAGTAAPTTTAALTPPAPVAPAEPPAEPPTVGTTEPEPVVGRRIAPPAESGNQAPTTGTEPPPASSAAAGGRRIAPASEPEPGHTTAGPAVERSDPAPDATPAARPDPPPHPSPEPASPSVPAAPEVAEPQPEPEPQAPGSDQPDPDDPEEFLAWLEQRRATLLWRLTARALEQSTRERERAEQAHQAVADSTPPSTEKLESARAFLVTCWGLVLAALGLILLLNVVSLVGDPVEFLTSLGDVLSADVLRIVLIATAILLLAGTLYFQAMKSYDWALTRRMHELTQARDDYITSRQQERRWQLVHRGLVDWATILSEVLHRPWTPPSSPEIERLPAYGGLPAAVGVAVPVPERDRPDPVFLARAVEVVCQKGWLSAEVARVIEASPANSGRSGDAQEQSDLPADLDLGQRRRGPRRELAQVAAAESTKQAATRALLELMSDLLHSGDVRLPDRAVMRVGFYSQGETTADRDFLTPRDTVAPLVNEIFSPSAQLDQMQVPERTVLFLPQGIEVPRSLRATQRLTVMPSDGTMTIRVDLSATVTHDNISLFHRVQRPEYRPTTTPDDFN